MTFETNFPLYPTKLPYVTVSAKGMSNGLSDIPNDGFDFGPDTILGATSKDQYGPPYTQTSGIQEAINYVFNQGGGEIVLGEGVFTMDSNYVIQQSAITNGHVINVPYNSTSNPIMTISIRGSAPPIYDYQIGYNATPSITPTNMSKGTIIYNPTYLPSLGADGSALFGATPPPSSATLNNNVNIFLTDLTFTSVQPTETQYIPTMVQLNNFAGFYLRNVGVNVNTPTGALNNPLFSGAIGISINQPQNGNGLAVLDNVYVVNYSIGIDALSVQHFHIKQAVVQYCAYGIVFSHAGNYPPIIDYIDLEQNTVPVHFQSSNPNSPEVIWLYNGKFQIQNQGPYSSTNWSNAPVNFTVYNNTQVYGEIEAYFTGGPVTDNPLIGTTGGSISGLYSLIIHQIEGYGSIGTYPIGSRGTTTAGTTTGTVAMQFEKFGQLYKKLMIQFSGYENDTATNQTISYPLPFNTSAVISANNTGLTISTTTSGITITAPNSTTTYSGIVIVEGY
jgi:hypothetical protein